MVKEGDYIYVHTLHDIDRWKGIEKGIYKVNAVRLTGIFIEVQSYINFMEYDQCFKIVPNKINKLLYKEL